VNGSGGNIFLDACSETLTASSDNISIGTGQFNLTINGAHDTITLGATTSVTITGTTSEVIDVATSGHVTIVANHTTILVGNDENIEVIGNDDTIGNLDGQTRPQGDTVTLMGSNNKLSFANSQVVVDSGTGNQLFGLGDHVGGNGSIDYHSSSNYNFNLAKEHADDKKSLTKPTQSAHSLLTDTIDSHAVSGSVDVGMLGTGAAFPKTPSVGTGEIVQLTGGARLVEMVSAMASFSDRQFSLSGGGLVSTPIEHAEATLVASFHR
jgi:hypothetical protein